MGSFDVACGISNLAIHPSDKMGLAILTPAPVYASNPSLDSGTIYKIGVNTDYSLLLPPIFGEYGDYGRIENIVPSATTALIEDIFKRPIQTVVDCIGSGSNIYDSTSVISKSYAMEGTYPDDSSWWYRATFEKMVTTVGFTAQGNDCYSFENYHMVRSTDATWSIYETLGEAQNKLAHSIKEPTYGDKAAFLLSTFADVTGVYPGFNPEEYEIVTQLRTLSGMYFLTDVFTKMSVAQDNMAGSWERKNNVKLKEAWDNYMDVLLRNSTPDSNKHGPLEVWEKVLLLRLPADFRDMTSLPKELHDKFLIYRGTNEFFNASKLLRTMASTNHLLTPSFCGEQDGNDPMSEALIAISAELLVARNAERKLWEIED